MQDLGCIEISDSGDRVLIEQTHLDRYLPMREPLLEQRAIDRQRVGTESFPCQPLPDIFVGEQTHGSQSALIPEQQVATGGSRLEVGDQAKMGLVGRVGQRQQAGHSGFEHEPVAAFELQRDTFPEPFDGRYPLSEQSPSQDRRCRLNRDRSEPAAGLGQVGQAGSEQRQQAAAHRFDFRQFGHWDDVARQAGKIGTDDALGADRFSGDPAVIRRRAVAVA